VLRIARHTHDALGGGRHHSYDSMT
jgi:hypothetical protein